jgi:hypothetical protein
MGDDVPFLDLNKPQTLLDKIKKFFADLFSKEQN